MIKLQIGDFEVEIGVLKSPIHNLKIAKPQFKITKLVLYHQLVISNFSSLITFFFVEKKIVKKKIRFFEKHHL